MLRNKLVRSDGSVIDSSVILSCEYTEEVNSGVNLAVGNATASELTVEILSSSAVQQGEVLTYYIIEDGVETKIGVFNAEKPTKLTKNSMRFSAYDNVVKTEKNFSDWLRNNQGLFPMTLPKLVQYACTYCGVTLVNTNFPNSNLSVKAFYADDLTCRQVLMWAAAIAGRFIRANVAGALEFSWYKDTNMYVQPQRAEYDISVTDDGQGNISVMSDEIELTDDGNGNVVINAKNLVATSTETGVSLASPYVIPYFQDQLSYETYTTDNIKRVQISTTDEDVGVIYPATADGNCFTVSGNLILSVLDSDKLNQVASALYTQLKDISYVPCSVAVPRTINVRAGDIIHIGASDGDYFATYVMKVSISKSGTSIESTGDKSYGSNVAVASEKYANLTGKMLSIEKSVDGLKVVASDLQGNVSTLQQTATNLSSRITSADGKISTLQQTAQSLTSRVEDAEGMISSVEQTAIGLTSRVETTEGNVSAVHQTAQSLTSRVEDAEDNISAFQQTATGLESRIQSAEGNVSTLQQTAAGFQTTVEDIEDRTSDLEQTSTSFTQRFGSIEDDLKKTKAYITTGLLDTQDSTEIYGVEIGQPTDAGGNSKKYARFTSDKLSFYDSNDNEVTQIGDKKMGVTYVDIIASPNPGTNGYGTFKQGGLVDITMADGSIVTKWVGGE